MLDRYMFSLPNILFFIFVIYALCTVFLSASIPASGLGLGETPWVRSIKQSVYLPLVFVALILVQFVVRDLSQLEKCMRSYIYSLLILCVFGCYQFVSFTFGLPYPDFLHNNISIPAGYQQYYGDVKRVSSLSGEPAMFGFLLVGVLGYMLPFVLNGIYIIYNNIVTFIVFIVIFITAIFTTSFSTYLALFLLFIFIFMELLVTRKYYLFLIIAVLMFVILSLIMLSDNIFTHRLNESLSGESYSTNIRVQMALTAIFIFIDHPLFGVGIGNYGFYVNEYSDVMVDKFWEPMGMLFKLLAELGVVGIVLFILPLLLVLLRVVKKCDFKSKTNHIDLNIKGLVYGMLITLLVSLFTIPSISWLNIWLFIGFLFSVDRMSNKNILLSWDREGRGSVT
ncbi:MAG: O-antigen ligase family protein [Pseudomonadota bacterium]